MVGSSTSISPSQAWAILSRHARDDIAPLRLKELCTDNDRVSSLVTVHSGSEKASSRFVASANARASASDKNKPSAKKGNNTNGYSSNNAHSNNANRILVADLSRQRMTLETLNHLLRLSTAVDVRGFISTLAWGQNNRFDPLLPNGNGTGNGTSNGNMGTNHHGGGGAFNFSKMGMTIHTNTSARHQRQHNQYHHEDANTLLQSSIHANSRPLSPARSTTSHVKKTRFAQSEFEIQQQQHQQQHSDDVSVAYSHSTYPYNSPSYASLINKAPLTTSPSMHMALRAPSHCNLQMLTTNGTNALDEIHTEWKRIQLVTSSIRKGQMKGVSGHILKNILVIGKGTAFSAMQFMYNALKNDEEGYSGLAEGKFERRGAGNDNYNQYHNARSMRFISSLDPVALHTTLSDWNPEQTCVISIIMNSDETDLLHLTQLVKQWLSHGLHSHTKRQDLITGKHVLFVTASEILYHTQAVTKNECTFLIPTFARSEAFTTFTAASLVPLSIAFGWDVVQQILNGAHDMDTHFVETNPRHNLPVLLALVDLWNDHFLSSSCAYKPCGGKMITPFMHSFASYPLFVATLEAQVCGRVNYGGVGGSGSGRNNRNHSYSTNIAPSGLVVDGGLCGEYDRILYQGRRAPQCEVIMAMEPQLPIRGSAGIDFTQMLLSGINGDNEQSNQDRYMSSFFAHADVMAFGSSGSRAAHSRGSAGSGGGGSFHFGGGLGSASFDSHTVPTNASDSEFADGNRPSSLLICSRCDPFTIGQLIALSEHRALVTAKLWNIEHHAFTQSHGNILRTKKVDNLTEKLDLLYQRLDLVGTVEEQDETDAVGGPKLNLATTSLLGHYATRMYEQKLRMKDKK